MVVMNSLFHNSLIKRGFGTSTSLSQQLEGLCGFKPCSCASILGQSSDCGFAPRKGKFAEFAFVDLQQFDFAFQKRTNIDKDVGVKSGPWIQSKLGLRERFIGQDTPNRRIPEPLATS